jgi:hypothetical protein
MFADVLQNESCMINWGEGKLVVEGHSESSNATYRTVLLYSYDTRFVGVIRRPVISTSSFSIYTVYKLIIELREM